MSRCKVFGLFIAMALTANAQTINLRGTVTNSAGKPIANAIVTLANQNLKDTTASNGTYQIVTSTPVTIPLLLPQLKTMVVEGGYLEISLPNPAPVKIEIFDIKGTLLKSETFRNTVTGFYRFNLEKNLQVSELLFIRTTIGQDALTFRYIPLNDNKLTVNRFGGSNASVNKSLLKILAISDTLKTSAAGYVTKLIPITSYDQQVNIVLDSLGTIIGHSPGCGKTPTLTSGSRTIQSSGQSRSYILRIPPNYDKNHPYPLVFGFHWVGGTMNDVDGGGSSGYAWSYYGLRQQADTSANSKMIFVAGQGISNGWENPQGRDIIFVDDMTKLIEGDLCVDTTRLFALGFSYGGSMSYSIACSRAKVFRAVAVYSGGQLSGCDGGKDPIAYLGIHGISDGTLGIDGGRAMRDKFVQNNGCTSQNPPEPKAGSLTHICTNYNGCKPGFPVEWCAFDGGHTPGMVDGGGDDGAKTWTKGVTWKFFTQF